jgi:hypothetical protein
MYRQQAHPMSKFWLVVPFLGLILLLSPAAGKGPSKTPARPAKAGIIGCWERTGDQPIDRFGPSSQLLCFKHDGRIWGISIDYGHGVDYNGRWRHQRSGRIFIQFPGTRPVVCSYWIDQAGDFLVTTGCKGEDGNDLWRRDKDMEETIGL